MEFFDADVIIGRTIDQEEDEAPTVADLLREMDLARVGKALVTNHKIALSTPEWGNEDLLRDLAASPRLRPIMGVYVVNERDDTPAAKRVDDLVKQGAAGVQLWPQACGFDFAAWQCPDLFNAMADRGLPLFMHADQTNYGNLHAVLQAFPRLKVVLQRVLYGDTRRVLAVMRSCPNLHICTSPGNVGGSVIEQLDRYFGSERTIFGSGLFKYDAAPAVAQVAYTQLPEPKRALIASGNLNRLMEGIR
ncbi:MAG: amidohydrolase family protein [Planctomycetota bacterium]|nr:amidohydrolase family protein [Planctomycetota bacterium]